MVFITTNLRRQFKNSGQFDLSNKTTITANSIYCFSLNKKYIIYDDVLLINNSLNDCEIIINNIHKSFLPRENSIVISSKNVKDVRIKNIGTTSINSDEIKLFYSHSGQEGQNKLNKFMDKIGMIANISLLKKLW